MIKIAVCDDEKKYLDRIKELSEQYADEIRAVNLEHVVEAANTVCFHSSFFLKGENHG